MFGGYLDGWTWTNGGARTKGVRQLQESVHNFEKHFLSGWGWCASPSLHRDRPLSWDIFVLVSCGSAGRFYEIGKALKDNPNLVYHPQRKKLSKILMKTEPPNMTFDTAPSTPLSNESATPVAFAASSTAKINGCVNGNVVYAQVPAQTLTSAPPGTVILAQAVNVRTPQHLSQRNQQTGQSVQQNNSHQNLSATMHQMLELYYTSLCEPAFPEPGEKSTLASPQHYLDQYHMLHHQAVTKQQQHGNPSLPQSAN
ncbi:hypothetical protein LOAG_07814 [Loa loa]|uniref:Uncharacterized protein n=1 Tax=Loa loa TaxID=7209 RepID=A0A1S0TV04_LOALO|nr:hypothetical protein LOAG_07814 [Loa loa]EFO20678.2 hypothetical protein LOAG_07814 [Loa loa]